MRKRSVALPVVDSVVPGKYWAPFATLVLGAAYEAMLLADVPTSALGGSNIVLLTLLGRSEMMTSGSMP